MSKLIRNWLLAGAALGAFYALGSMVLGAPPGDFSSVVSRILSLTFSGAVAGCVAAMLQAFIIWTR